MKTVLRDVLIILVSAVVIILLLQATVQTSPVIGSCMEDSLQREGQRLLISKLAYRLHEPERGDIVVFHPPHKPDGAIPYIKRIIGLPGETVEVRGEVVYINGSPLEEPYVKSPPPYTVAELKIPEDEYFVLGDNRPVADDSHNGWTVNREDIIGKAWLSIWPPSTWGLAPNYSFSE
jgi:signal peptidase I